MKRIALIGAGGIATRHAQSIASSGDRATLAGIVEPDEARRVAFSQQWSCAAYPTLQQLCEQEALDAAIVATPPSTRLDILSVLLSRGIPALVEKPIAMDFETACQIQKLASGDRATLIVVGYCHRFLDAVQKTKELIEQGQIGDVIWMQTIFASFSPEMRERWFTDPAISGGGAAMDNACHALDLFSYLNGSIERLEGSYRHSWPGRGEESFSISARARNGALGAILGSYLSSLPRLVWEVCGTKATLRYEYGKHGHALEKLNADGTTESLPVKPPGDRYGDQFAAWLNHLEGKHTALATLAEACEISRGMESLKNSQKQSV